MKGADGSFERHCLLFVFKNALSMIESEFFNSLPPSLTVLKNEKAKFKVVLRIY
jgi:hypothetical protein